MLRIPHCLDNRLTDDGKVVSPTHPPHFTPQEHYISSSGCPFGMPLSILNILWNAQIMMCIFLLHCTMAETIAVILLHIFHKKKKTRFLNSCVSSAGLQKLCRTSTTGCSLQPQICLPIVNVPSLLMWFHNIVPISSIFTGWYTCK
jgi:hypothetical protein